MIERNYRCAVAVAEAILQNKSEYPFAVVGAFVFKFVFSDNDGCVAAWGCNGTVTGQVAAGLVGVDPIPQPRVSALANMYLKASNDPTCLLALLVLAYKYATFLGAAHLGHATMPITASDLGSEVVFNSKTHGGGRTGPNWGGTCVELYNAVERLVDQGVKSCFRGGSEGCWVESARCFRHDEGVRIMVLSFRTY
jgi:hypothetical protein